MEIELESVVAGMGGGMDRLPLKQEHLLFVGDSEGGYAEMNSPGNASDLVFHNPIEDCSR